MAQGTIRTSSIGGTLAGRAGLPAHAVHVLEADLAADAAAETLQGAYSAAGGTLVGAYSFSTRVDHGGPRLNFGAGGKGQVLEKVLALGGKFQQGPVEIKVAHGGHGLAAVGGETIGRRGGGGRKHGGASCRLDGGATPIAFGTAIEVVEGGDGEAAVGGNFGETIGRVLAGMAGDQGAGLSGVLVVGFAILLDGGADRKADGWLCFFVGYRLYAGDPEIIGQGG